MCENLQNEIEQKDERVLILICVEVSVWDLQTKAQEIKDKKS